MKKLIAILTLFAMLCVVTVSASEATISVYYQNDLKVNFTMELDENSTYSLDNVSAISSSDPGTTISVVYNGENMGTFAVSAKEIYAEYSTEDPDVLIISGTEEGVQAGTDVTVSVFYSGKEYSNLVDGQIGQIASILVAETDAEGKWEVSFIPVESANYDIYAGTNQREVLVKTVYVMADRKSVINTIKTADKAGVKAVFDDNAKLKGVVADMSVIEDMEDTSSIGEILYGIREELTDVDDILKYIDLACLMAVMEDEKTSASLETVLGELDALGVTVENLSVYEENKSEAISESVAKRLAKSVNDGIEGFKDDFTDALILGGVEGSETWADIAPFMELLNNSDYEKNVYDASIAVVGNNYDTVDDLESAIKNAVKPSSGGSGGGGGGGGGSFGGSSNKVDNAFGIIPETELDETVNDKAEEEQKEKLLFTDVPESHWAFDSIHYLYWQNVVSGDDSGRFNPDNNITRAEMVKMLCNSFGLEIKNKASFTDVSSKDWFYGYAGAAYSVGLLKGSDGKMNPNDLLTREDMAVLVYRFAQYAGVEFAPSDVTFADAENISTYAEEAIGALNTAGYINGMGDGRYAPKGNATRAQVAKILYRFIKE